MLLVAVRSGEAIPDTLNKKAIKCLQILTSFNAHIMLNSMFEENKLRLSAPSSVTTILLYRSFLWTISETPEVLSASVLTTNHKNQNYLLHEALVLNYSTLSEIF